MKKTLAILALLVFATLSFGELSATYAPVSYNCNGSVQAFSFPYAFFETTDLSVYLVTSNGVSTLLEEGAGAGKYTIYAANADYSRGATITAGTQYSSGNRIVISREIPYGQGLSINGDFVPAKPLEQALDKLAGQIQQVKDSVGRTITAPVTDPKDLNFVLPPYEARAGKIAFFDETGALATIPFINTGIIYADGSTIDISVDNVIGVKNGGIDTAQLSTTVSDRLNASLTNLAANSVGTTQITNGAVTFAKLSVVSTNVSTTSQTNLVTEGGVKDYVDTKSVDEAKNYAMQYSGSVLYSTNATTSYNSLNTGIGSRAFVHIKIESPSAQYFYFGVNGDVPSDNGSVVGGTTQVYVEANKVGYISVMTDSGGLVTWKSSGTQVTTVTLLAYQILQ